MTLVFVTFFGLMALGLPIGIVIGFAGLLGITQMGPNFLQMVPDRMFAGLNIFTFLAMPLFILTGEIMNRTGITHRLVEIAEAFVGWMRGGLAHTNMVASVLFAGISGSATADAAAFGNTLVPAMEKAGYTRRFACAVTAAGSIIGPTIPPSSQAIVYGSIMGVSIAGLFAAGILPGLLICAFCMIVIAALGRRLGLPRDSRPPSLRRMARALWHGAPVVVLPGFIVSAIVFGITTPTEAASIAVGYSLILGGLIYRRLGWADLYASFAATARMTGVLFLVIGAAAILGWWMAFNQIPQTIADALLSVSDSKPVIIALMLGLLLFFGLFMDVTAILIILAPVLAEILSAIGMDPVHAGIMIILALNISLMTPPVGACLFVLASITKETVESIASALWPFILAEFAVLLLVAYWPRMTLLIPHLLGL